MRCSVTCVAIVILMLQGCGDVSPAENATSPIAENAQLVQVSSEFEFTEGPARDPRGNVYFTDQPSNRILRWNTDGSISTYLEESGRANGLYFDHSGNLIACADLKNQLWRITPEKRIEILIEDVNGKLLNGPNDVWVAPDGSIYFTDPFFQRRYWTRTEKEIDAESVYHLSAVGELLAVADDLVQPNGIIGTPNGEVLYVADIGDDRTWRYEIEPDGRLANKTLFVEMGSDGMTLDEQGNVYLTGDGVTVFNPAGEQITHIDVPERWTANVTFGGAKRRTLFITATKSVYTLEMRVHGV